MRAAFEPTRITQVRPRWELDPDLVLYLPFWNMPDGQTYLSPDVVGHTATRTGATPIGQGGWSFDGTDDSVSVPHHNSLNFERTDSFSFGRWVKRNTTGTQEFFLGKDAGWKGYVFQFGADNKLTIEIWNSSGPDVGIRTASSMTFSAGTWYCICVTYNGNSLASGVKAYVQGVSEPMTASVDTLTATIQTTNNLFLGRSNTGAANFFNGTDGECRIWNRELTALDALEYFNETKGLFGGG